jgi:acyl-CoA synthetase (AMP-forming)/AMP-acid ligase II
VASSEFIPAKYAIPKIVRIVDTIPLTEMQKVNKNLLRRQKYLKKKLSLQPINPQVRSSQKDAAK